MQKQLKPTSVILDVVVMQVSIEFSSDTGLSNLQHLAQQADFTATGLEPGQCSVPLTLAAVFCENALSHSKTKGRKWSKGDCWGKRRKIPHYTSVMHK